MFSQVLTIARFTIIESLRNRLLLLSFLVIGISFAMVEFIGDLAITEHRITQVAILAAFLRMSAVVMITLFVVSSTVRELHDKTLEMILAMPIRRGSYYLGKLIGYLYIAALVAVFFAALLLLYADAEQVAIWLISLFFELVLVVALSLVMLFTFNQVPSALTAVFIFYGASRIVTSIFLMAKYPIIAHTSMGQQFMDAFIELLTWLLPDLHRFTQTEWLTYNTGDWATLLPLLGQTVVYLVFLSFIALFDFYRKNF
ncbi:MAG: ABC transporter permease [Gammaproteobacteria bacterium]|nr:MAG: ABC transporter permease [Gammaproteobacteria bacterium]